MKWDAVRLRANIYQVAESVESVELEGEWILLQTENHYVTRLNETGGLLWSFLQTPGTLTDILGYLDSLFEVDFAQLENDATSFLIEMLENELITFQKI